MNVWLVVPFGARGVGLGAGWGGLRWPWDRRLREAAGQHPARTHRHGFSLSLSHYHHHQHLNAPDCVVGVWACVYGKL